MLRRSNKQQQDSVFCSVSFRFVVRACGARELNSAAAAAAAAATAAAIAAAAAAAAIAAAAAAAAAA